MRRCATLVTLALFLFSFTAVSPVHAACTLSGVVYRDYDNDGVRDANETGQEGITVTAYDAAGNVVNATTNANGAYTMNVNAAAARVEFDVPQSFLRSGPWGGASPTTVTFVDCNGTVTLDFGVVNPAEYCHFPDNAVLLATTCFVLGDQINGVYSNLPVLVTFPYNNGAPATSTNPPDYNGPDYPEADAVEIGSTWGVAYHRTSDSLFVLPYVKRHTGLGPGGITTLYRISNASDTGAGTPVVQPFLDFATYFGATVAGDDGRTAATDYLTDETVYGRVGKVGWGDLEISDDDTTLYTVNLADRQLYEVAIGDFTPSAPATVSRYPIPNPCPAPVDQRPFATKFKDGRLYIGLVCSGESTQVRADMRAHIYVFNPQTGNFAAAFNFALNYPRACVNGSPVPCFSRSTDPAVTPFEPLGNGEWLPWLDDFPFSDNMADPNFDSNNVAYPQPMLTDIEFDGADMIIAMRDRFPDQQGEGNARGPNFPADGNLYNSRGGGDILRACWNGGGWTLETGASCGGINGSGAPGEGPGGSEYYGGDTFVTSHDELGVGGMAQLARDIDVALTVYDPIPVSDPSTLYDGGVRWLRNDMADGTFNPGQVTRAFRIYDGNGNTGASVFGKANGLGDLEIMCGPSPLEIGNRVWEDLDLNGRQDPGEQVFANVTLSLYDSQNQLIAQTTTDANGEYYFNATTIDAWRLQEGLPRNVAGLTYFDIDGDNQYDPNEPRGIMPNFDYVIRIDAPANYTGAPSLPLQDYFATTVDGDANLRDSDGQVTNTLQRVSTSNVPETTLTTGMFGENNHTYDFGFALVIVKPTPTPSDTSGVPTPMPTIPAVTRLPDTGESPLQGARVVVIGFMLILVLSGGTVAVIRRRRQN